MTTTSIGELATLILFFVALYAFALVGYGLGLT